MQEWKEEEEEKPPVTIATDNKTKSSHTNATLLSFEDEVGEGEEFKVKKSSLSKKLARDKEVKEEQKVIEVDTSSLASPRDWLARLDNVNITYYNIM